MGSFGVVINKVFIKFSPKDPFIVYGIKVRIDKLLLDCSVVSFNVGINLGTPGVNKKVGDIVFG